MKKSMNFIKTLMYIVVAFVLCGTKVDADNSLLERYEQSVSKQPFVVFRARGGIPGHTFIGTGFELDDGFVFYRSFMGFYPKGGGKLQSLKVIFNVAVEGELTYKWSDVNFDVEYRVKVGDTEINKVESILKKWSGADYNLFDKNCSKLAYEIAKVIELKLPKSKPGNTLPKNYIKSLKDAN